MPKKITYEFVKAQFGSEGCILGSIEYINAHQKLEYECPNGHKHNIGWNNWQQGRRCPTCAGQSKPTIEFIRSEFAKEDYILLTEVYINNRQKLEYTCSNGHESSVAWSSWQRGRRCKKCFAGRIGSLYRLNIKFVYRMFEKDGYELLTQEYKNAHQKLNYVCPVGHKGSMSWINWKNGRRCPTCLAIKFSGSGNPNWQGGIACEPYCEIWLNKEYKEDLKARDNHQCQNPDCWGTSEKICGHHVDYDKKNCGPSNIITLCISCNSRANKDRDYWTKFYQEIMNKKYGYKYGENNEKKVTRVPC